MEEALKDERFAHILTDPRFRKMPKHIRKVTVDKRFKGMFKDRKFKEKCALNKHGRPLELTPSENLKNLYDVSSESGDDENENKDCSFKKNSKDTSKVVICKNYNNKSELGENTSWKQDELFSGSQSERELQNSKISVKHEFNQKLENRKLKNLEKKKGKLSLKNKIDNKVKDSAQIKENEAETSSSDSEADDIKSSAHIKRNESETNSDDSEVDDDSSDDTDDSESDDSSEDQIEELDHQWEELQNEAPDTDEITQRIAVCNMDWDRIRAEDLFACFNSFKPSDGCINSVKIYPSEYGLKRMEEEKMCGPPELVEESLPLDEEEPEDAKTSKYHREKLRQYQINRLKYYYAVIDCDTPETANTLYEQLNGLEYESSSIRFDLRFIPDDVTFDHEPVSVADKVPDPAEYKPRLFVTTALQQVKVNLTWDETDPKRRETLQKAFTEPNNIEKDIQDYLASSSGESDEEVTNPEEEPGEKLSMEDRIARYREILQSIEEKEKEEENKYEVEVTWEPGFKKKTEEIVKEKIKKESLNPFEEILQKKREMKKLKKKELKIKQEQEEDESLSDMSDEDSTSISNRRDQDTKKLAELALISDSKKEINLDENYNKKKKKREMHKDDFKCNVNDQRFSAIYSSHLYNIDPSDPHFKKTEGNLALIQEKQRRLKSTDFFERNPKNPNRKKARYF